MAKKRKHHLTAAQTILLSFAAMALTGAALLALPIASRDGRSIGFLDALFTATSANCVTGLVVVNTMEHWTLFGKIVILVLIQIGGIGLISLLTAGMLLLRRRISLRSRLVIRASFNQDSMGGMVRLLRSVIRITLIIEGIGAVFLAIGLHQTLSISPGRAIWYGVFQSISSFCNAGFDIFSENSMVPYQTNLWLNLPIMLLIISGGLGFPVIAELARAARNTKRRGIRFRLRHLSLHAKIALMLTGALLFGGAALFIVFEGSNPATLGHLGGPEKALVSFFQSVTLRTCGYDSIGQGGLNDNSKLLSSLLMFIGGCYRGRHQDHYAGRHHRDRTLRAERAEQCRGAGSHPAPRPAQKRAHGLLYALCRGDRRGIHTRRVRAGQRV